MYTVSKVTTDNGVLETGGLEKQSMQDINYKENGLEEGHDLFVVVLFASLLCPVKNHGQTVYKEGKDQESER